MKFLNELGGDLVTGIKKGADMTVEAYLKPAYHDNGYCRKFAMAEIAETVADIGDVETAQDVADRTSQHLLWLCLGRDLSEFTNFKLKPYYATLLVIVAIALVLSVSRRMRQKKVGGVTPSSLFGALCCMSIVMSTYASVALNWRWLLPYGILIAIGSFILMAVIMGLNNEVTADGTDKKNKKPFVVFDSFLNRPVAVLRDIAIAGAVGSVVGAVASVIRVKVWETSAKIKIVNPLAMMTQGVVQYAM